MTHLDLFTGIGGFHLAAQWAGFETVGFSEIEPYCCALLAEKWPRIKNYGDIRNADFSLLRGRITVLSAGVPCQPASLAGKRRGAEDDRWLWPATLDVIESVQPAWCIFENPVGILTLDEFDGILLRLESLGHQVRAFSVPANAVGAKHRRQRVFIVANRNVERLERAEYVRQRNGVNEQFIDMGGETLADGREGSNWAFRLTEPPLCRATDGIRNRSHRLKALGNAVVPQQAFPFFQAIYHVALFRAAVSPI
jgi:DNA (cytosine-5)-methyltransferase 1